MAKEPLEHLPQRGKSARRGASRADARQSAKAIVQALEWLDYPLIYWTGVPEKEIAAGLPPPAPLKRDPKTGWPRRKSLRGQSPSGLAQTPEAGAHYCGAAGAVQNRLAKLPAGCYAVRLSRPRQGGEAMSLPESLRLASCVVDEVVPVNPAQIARSLRRLIDSARFKVQMPLRVGDVAAWTTRCQGAVQRAREALDTIAGGKLEENFAGVIIGEMRPGGGARSADAGRPASPGDVGRGWSGWPVDILNQVIRLAGHHALGKLARAPGAGGIETALAVRECLLFNPASLGLFIERLPVLLSLHDRLAHEPARRLQLAADLQRKALEDALFETGLSGNPVRLMGARRARGDIAAIERFCQAYQTHLVEGLQAHFGDDDKVFNAQAHMTPPRPATDLLYCLRQILDGALLRSMFLGDATTDNTIGGECRYVAQSAESYIQLGDDAVPLTFESLAQKSAGALYEYGRARIKALSPRVLLSLGATGGLPAIESMPVWMETLCQTWPPGATGHEHAHAMLGLLREWGQSALPAGEAVQSPIALHALDELAGPLIELAMTSATESYPRSLGLPAWRQKADSTLLYNARICRRAMAAGVEPADLRHCFAPYVMPAIRRLLEVSPQSAARFARFVREHSSDLLYRPGHECALSMRWAWAYASLGEALFLSAFNLAMRGGATQPLHFIQTLAQHVSGQESPWEFEARLPSAETSAARRSFLSAALRLLRTPLESGSNTQHDELRMTFLKSLEATVHALGYDAPGSALLHFLDRIFNSLRKSSEAIRRAHEAFLSAFGAPSLRILAALTLGRPERLLALSRQRLDVNWQELAQVARAWRYLRAHGTLREMFSQLIARVSLGRRALRVLARLGLCLKLHTQKALEDALLRLSAPDSPAGLPPELEQAMEGVSQSRRERVLELLRWRGDRKPPDRLGEILLRPQSLRSELESLQRLSAPSEGAAQRLRHLEAQLADSAALAAWGERDLDKFLDSALDEARLERFEAIARRCIDSYLEQVIERPVPPPQTARQQRNWDNALRLYFSIEDNRALLRRLLRREAAGDRGWFREQPNNARFLAEVGAAGIDTEAWLAPFARWLHLAGGRFRFEIETDPLHVLQMGNYFETCLSEGAANAFSTVANAAEINKRVIYVYDDQRNTVIGRKLLVMTPKGVILGFRTYGEFPKPKAGAGELPMTLKQALDRFCAALAGQCKATLQPLKENEGVDPAADQTGINLFAKWYDDGVETFELDGLPSAGPFFEGE